MSLADELAVPPKAGERAGITLNGDGSGQITTGPLTEAPDWRELLRVWHLDPDVHEIVPGTVQMRAWDGPVAGGGTTRYYYYKAGIRLVGEGGSPLTRVVPAKIYPAKPSRRIRDDGWETCLVIPDSQHGGRNIDGVFYPFHDDRALDVTLQAARTLAPKQVVLLGDMLDLPMFSTFDQDRNFANTLDYALQELHNYIAALRANAQDARIVYLFGNHEKRLQRFLSKTAPTLLGVKGVRNSRPILSVTSLLELDGLEVETVSHYPTGQHFINSNIRCVHGEYTSVAKMKAEYHVSTLCGHLHRVELCYDTRYINGADPRGYVYGSIGCTCKISGPVPSTHSANDEDDRPAPSRERWQQAFGVVEYEPSGDESFAVTPVLIHDGIARHNGVTYRSRVA